MFEQAIIPVQDKERFGEVNATLENLFSAGNVASFLRKVQSSGLRIRDFEAILSRGLIGAGTPALYGALGNSDRGRFASATWTWWSAWLRSCGQSI